MNVLQELRQRFAASLQQLVDDPAPSLDMIRPAQDPRFGDYQANCAMPLVKQLGGSSRDIAQQIVDRLEVADLCEPPEIAGPGFINLRLREDWIDAQLLAVLHDDRLGVNANEQPRTYVIDYSSPNVAKPMHVGHIRSTVIGDALSRTLRFLGHRVIGDNHLGDWGTQFGMIIYGYKHFLDAHNYQQNAVRELGRLYQHVNRLVEYQGAKRALPELKAQVEQLQQALETHDQQPAPQDKAAKKNAAKARRRLTAQVEEAAESLSSAEAKVQSVEQDDTLAQLAQTHADIDVQVLQETAKLHHEDPENLRLWNEFLPACKQDIQRIYDRLGVRFDCEHGESFYQERLAAVVDDLRRNGLAQESEGAICVFLDDFDTPMIVQKKDGAFLYATTDLATIQFRMETWQPDAMLYVVDHRQSEHFDKLFAAARRWGFGDVELTHISFGTVLGKDHRPYRTRSGDVVGLEGVLDEAVQRALQVVVQNDDSKPGGPELEEQERQNVAEIVGQGAVKYADLSHNRTSDYVFDYDKMLALEGNTATYVQYSYARTRSLFAKGQIDPEQLRAGGGAIVLADPMDRVLALQLLRFEEALAESVVDYRPNQLTNYIFELATAFNKFWHQCEVLKAESEELRQSRLLLCDLIGRTIRQGLDLLGIEVIDRM